MKTVGGVALVENGSHCNKATAWKKRGGRGLITQEGVRWSQKKGAAIITMDRKKDEIL